MKLEISSVLQLKKIQINRFKIEENIEGINKIRLYSDFDLIVWSEKDDSDKQNKGIHFVLKVNEKVKNPALKCLIDLIVLFSIDKNISEDQQIKFILYNGLSIVYGIVRGMVYQACSILPPSMRMLPTVDLNRLIKLKLEEIKASST